MPESVYILGAAERSPLPPVNGNANALLLAASAIGKSKVVVFKVAKWDPNLHPKGYKGLFIETPDKIDATDAQIGDVLATKNGKVFKVEKQTEKGVKVNPVDPDTGEVKTGYTVIGNTTQVAVVDSGSNIGTIEEIAKLDPGTYVQHVKSGKRFIIHKHGKWTTVYPVDNNGVKQGKHTVLPPETMVEIAAPSVSDAVTTEMVEAYTNEAKALAKPDVPKDNLTGLMAEVWAETTGDDTWGLPPIQLDMFPEDFDASAPDAVEQVMNVWKQKVGGDGWATGDQLLQYADSHEEIRKALETAWYKKKQDAGFAPDKAKTYDAFASVWNMVLDEQVDANFVKADGYMKSPTTVGDPLLHLMPSQGEFGDPELHIVVNPELTPTTVAKVGPEVFESDPSGAIGLKNQEMGDFDPMAPGAIDRMIEIQTSQTAWQFKVKKKHKDEFKAELEKRWEKRRKLIGNGDNPQVKEGAQPVDNKIVYDAFAGVWNSDMGKPVDYLDSDYPVQLGHYVFSIDSELDDAGKPVLVARFKQPTGLAGQDDTDKTPIGVAVLVDFDPMADDFEKKIKQLAGPIVEQNKWAKDYVDEHLSEVVKKWGEKKAQLEAISAPSSVPEQLEEIMPTKIPKVPKKYPEGVGENTKVIIEIGTAKYVHDPNQSVGDVYVVKRVAPDGSTQTIGSAGGIGKARKMARAMSADHEEIEEVRYQLSEHSSVLGTRSVNLYMKKLKAGDFMVTNGEVVKIKEVVTDEDGSLSRIYYFEVGQNENDPEEGLSYITPWRMRRVDLTPPVQKKDQKHLQQVWDQAVASGAEDAKAEVDADWVRGVLDRAGFMSSSEEVIRSARPVKWIPELQHGWDLEELSGVDWQSEAHPRLRALGWREVKPRQKDFVRYINKNGQRLTVFRDDGGKVTEIDHQKLVFETIDTQSATEFHATLTEALASGGSFDHLDPKNSEVPALRTPHVQQLIYDTAVGKTNNAAEKAGLGKKKAKVKTDAAYRDEIEKADAVPDAMKIMEDEGLTPVTKVKVIAKYKPVWGLEDDNKNWYAIPIGLDDDEAIAQAALLRNQGVANIMMGKPGEASGLDFTVDPDLVVEPTPAGFEEAAKKLAKLRPKIDAFEKGKGKNPTKLDDESVRYLSRVMTRAAEHYDTAEDAAAERVYTQAEAIREQLIADEIVARRKAEGTVASLGDQFDIPTWDALEFEPQSMEDIENIVGEQKPVGVFEAEMDVPGFYNGGLVRDAVLLHRSQKTWGKVTLDNDDDMVTKMLELGAEVGPNKEPIKPGQKGSYPLYDGTSMVVYEGEKRIEYVPHDSTYSGQAPTSQRGRLTLTGYTPTEAADRLQGLGVIGQLEPEVPFKAVMRSGRRVGMPVPIHDEYVRGEAEFPKTDGRLTHGLTGGGEDAFQSVVDTGALLSIEQRYYTGILSKIKTASPSGDIRSGIDHAVFVGYGSHSACGSYSNYKFVLKPSAFLARDVVFAPQDFGSADSRYSQYKKWKNRLQGEVEEEKTNLYAPTSAAVRQKHLDYISKGSSAEYNVGPSIPLEDVEYITVPAEDVSKVRKKLEKMLADGRLASIPTVIAAGSSEADKAVNAPLNQNK